jgi:hypothetical protein
MQPHVDDIAISLTHTLRRTNRNLFTFATTTLQANLVELTVQGEAGVRGEGQVGEGEEREGEGREEE